MRFSSFIITPIFLLLLPSLFAASPKEVSSKAKEVTIFLNGAQVTRTANTPISSGTSTLLFTKLPARLDPGSVQVKGEGSFTILSVTHQLKYPDVVEIKVVAPPKAEIAALQAQRQKLQDQISLEQTLLAIFQKEEALLNANQKLTTPTTVATPAEIAAMADLIRGRYKDIYQQQWDSGIKIRDWQAKVAEIDQKLAALNAPAQPQKEIKGKVYSEVLVTVTSSSSLTGRFTLTYQVPGAGWLPAYDLRVKDVAHSIKLSYKANVFQSSGEDWKNVKLTLSTGNPNQKSTSPVLNPWYLNYQQNQPVSGRNGGKNLGAYNANVRTIQGRITDANSGEPLIGAVIVIKGTTVGVMADERGYYSLSVPPGGTSVQVSYVGYKKTEMAISNTTMNIPLATDVMTLDEVVVTAYETDDVYAAGRVAGVSKAKRQKKMKDDFNSVTGTTIPLIINPIQKATNIEFEIKETYTIPSDGKSYGVEMTTYDLDAEYEYYCVPKLDLNAYLTARIAGFESLNLLEAEANLFFEGTFLGKTLLNVRSTSDTMNIGLGPDRNIVVTRTKLKEFSKRQFVGGKRSETRAFDIEVRNQKRQRVRLIVEDQFPVSQNAEIEIIHHNYKGAILDENTGILRWTFDLKGGKSDKANLKYEVKLPKSASISLE